jgi:uncharacterized protein YjbI with pentapeptide repeats
MGARWCNGRTANYHNGFGPGFICLGNCCRAFRSESVAGTTSSSHGGRRLTESDFTGSNLDRRQFRQTNLSRANLDRATNVLLNPAENKVKGATISLDADIGVVTVMGMQVSGVGAAPKRR